MIITVLIENSHLIDFVIGLIMLSSCISIMNHDHSLQMILTIRIWRKRIKAKHHN